MDFNLPTYLWVQSVVRRLAQEGQGVYILQKGDADRGVILVKLLHSDFTCKLLIQQRNIDGELEWMHALKNENPDEKEADAYIARATARDPDLWVVEVENSNGRNPFTL